MYKKIAAIQLALTLALSLVACGEEEVVEKPTASDVEMTIQIENGRYVNITGLSITSDTRVDEDEQINKPENTGVSSVLGDIVEYETTLHSGDVLTVQLSTPDPNFYKETDDSGNVTGVQKFVFTVIDNNGNAQVYNDIELMDGAYYIITSDGVYTFDNESDAHSSGYSLYGNYIGTGNSENEEVVDETVEVDATEVTDETVDDTVNGTADEAVEEPTEEVTDAE